MRGSKKPPSHSSSRWSIVAVVTTLALIFISYSSWELHNSSVMHAEQHKASRRLESSTELMSFGLGGRKSSHKALSSASGVESSAHSAPKKGLSSKFYRVNKCFAYPYIDFYGIAVKSGGDNMKETAGECCDSCHAFVPEGPDGLSCNLWAWCGDKEKCGENYKYCWLKHFSNLQIASPTDTGVHVAWTMGTKEEDDMREVFGGLVDRKKGTSYEEAEQHALNIARTRLASKGEPRPFHTITSFQGFGVEWSMRVHYYHFKKMRAKCRAQLGDGCEMGGFTRLLHDDVPDQLMNEIPTVVVGVLPEEKVPHEDYIVLNRPYAFVEWIKIANVPEKYIFMSEPDHIFIHPLPNLMKGEWPAAFPFFYVDPTDPPNIPHIKRHTGITSVRQLEEIPPIGNSPVFMSMDDIKKVMPTWHNVTVNVYQDQQANQEWGWVQEMYGFALSCWLVGFRNFTLHRELMSQPPYDTEYEPLGGYPFYIIHYTYGLDYNNDGKMLPDKVGQWHFDKRALDTPIKRNMAQPPPLVNASLTRHLVRAFNEATDAIPCWDKYSEHGKIPDTCDEAPKGYLATEDAAKDGNTIYSTVPNPPARQQKGRRTLVPTTSK